MVPALDDLALADSEFQGIAAVVRRIEFRAIGEGAAVVHLDLIASLGLARTLGRSDDFGLEVL